MFVKRALLGLFAAVVLGLCLLAMPQPAKALSNTSSPLYPITDNDVRAIVAAPDGSTYVGGLFTMVGSTPRNRLVHILADGTTIDPAFDPDIDNGVSALFLDTATNTLYIGGNFQNVNGSTPRNGVAALNATTGVATAFDPSVTFGAVNAMILDSVSGTLYVGGNFTTVNGGTTRNNFAAFSTSTGIATSFDPDPDGAVLALELDSTSSTLYAGGQFTTFNAGATPRNRLAAFSTGSGLLTAFDPDMGGSVRTLDIDTGTGLLYAGGSFNTVNGGTVRNNVAALNTTTSVATAFDPNIASGWCLSPPVSAIVLSPTTNTLYVVGCYGDVNAGTPRDSVAEFSLSTSVATSFAPAPSLQPLGSGGGVFALALNAAGTSLYVGGKYTDNPGFTEVNLKCFGSCIAAPTPPGPTPTPTPVSTATLAPTGDDSKLPIGIAISSFALGSLGMYWFGLRNTKRSQL